MMKHCLLILALLTVPAFAKKKPQPVPPPPIVYDHVGQLEWHTVEHATPKVHSEVVSGGEIHTMDCYGTASDSFCSFDQGTGYLQFTMDDGTKLSPSHWDFVYCNPLNKIEDVPSDIFYSAGTELWNTARKVTVRYRLRDSCGTGVAVMRGTYFCAAYETQPPRTDEACYWYHK